MKKQVKIRKNQDMSTDTEKTAEVLAKYIPLEKEEFLSRLNHM